MLWGGCSESQCKDYLLHAKERNRLADQHGAVRLPTGGLAALKHLTDRSFLCLHFHMDKDERLTPCIFGSGSPAAGNLSTCQTRADMASAPETPKPRSESDRALSIHPDTCR